MAHHDECLRQLVHKVSQPDANDNVFEAFLSHAWGKDLSGRDNHGRVKKIYKGLSERGLRPWLDELEMRDNINEVLCRNDCN